MRCPECTHPVNRVTDTRPYVAEDGETYTRRRRVCAKCRARFTTFEVYELPDVSAATRLRAIQRDLVNALKSP